MQGMHDGYKSIQKMSLIDISLISVGPYRFSKRGMWHGGPDTEHHIRVISQVSTVESFRADGEAEPAIRKVADAVHTRGEGQREM